MQGEFEGRGGGGSIQYLSFLVVVFPLPNSKTLASLLIPVSASKYSFQVYWRGSVFDEYRGSLPFQPSCNKNLTVIVLVPSSSFWLREPFFDFKKAALDFSSENWVQKSPGLDNCPCIYEYQVDPLYYSSRPSASMSYPLHTSGNEHLLEQMRDSSGLS